MTSTYTYGADGLRRSSTVNGVTTYYVYDGQMLVREMQQNAQGVLQSTATYLTGPRGSEYRRDDTQAEGTYSDSTGTHPAGKTRWYVYDGLGSVVGEVDPSGNLTSSGTFDVYGAKRQGGTGAATSRQGFVGSLGHVSDAETGLVYMRARYYDPNVGRFVSEDPGLHGNNWFAYCDNNPANEIDADGRVGKWMTLFLSGIKDSGAFEAGCLMATLALAGPTLLKAGSLVGGVTSILAGLMAVGLFAVALGSNPAEVADAMGASIVGLVMVILDSANAGQRLLAGANAIADVAISAMGGYSLVCVAALVADEAGI